MNTFHILKLQTKVSYPNLELDIHSALNLEKSGMLLKAGERYRKVGHKILETTSAIFALDYYIKASSLFVQAKNFEKAIHTEKTIYEIHRLVNNLNSMAVTTEKIASFYKYYLNQYKTAGEYYMISAKLHEQNQNYFSAFKKAQFACQCLDTTNYMKQRRAAHGFAFRMALQSQYFEKAGMYAKKWLALTPKDYSVHYLSICMKGYKTFLQTDRQGEALMFVNEIIIAHYEKGLAQENISTRLLDAQKLYISEHKVLNSDYNTKILALLDTSEKKIKYCHDLRIYTQNLGLNNISDFFYLQEKNLQRTLAKKNNSFVTFGGLTLWKWTCDYGTSLVKWLLTSLLIILLFGLLYCKYDVHYSSSNLQLLFERVKPTIRISGNQNWFSPFYYSVVTFATLGYGDITPNDLSGQIFSVLEVLIGYMMLGGLLSVFSKKIIR